MRYGSLAARPESQAPEAPSYLIEWSWKAEGVSKLVAVAVGVALCVLIWRVSESWWLVAVVGGVMSLLIIATHPAMIAGIVQLRRDALLARVRITEIRAEYIARRAEIEAKRQIQLEGTRLQASLRAEADRTLLARAGAVEEEIRVDDPIRDLAVTLICEAYQHHDAEGWIARGIISRRRIMEAGFSQAQYEELARALQGAGIAVFERQQWRLNIRGYRDAEEATRALLRWYAAQEEDRR